METTIIDEFRQGLTEIKDGITRTDQNVVELNAGVKKLQEENERLQTDFNKIRRFYIGRQAASGAPRPAIRPGLVSDDCAKFLAHQLIIQCARSGRLEILSQSAATRDALLNSAREFFGLELRTALTTTDIPLPNEYSGELRALIAQFGVVRSAMFPYPIGMGTAKPPRMGARPQFGSIAMSAAIPEGSPGITLDRKSV